MTQKQDLELKNTKESVLRTGNAKKKCEIMYEYKDSVIRVKIKQGLKWVTIKEMENLNKHLVPFVEMKVPKPTIPIIDAHYLLPGFASNTIEKHMDSLSIRGEYAT